MFDSVDAERNYRKQQLAAGFRLFGKFGFSEGVAGHITVRDPLHRPADFQRHLAELSGDDAEAYITETLYRTVLLGVSGRPISDHTLGEM